MYFNEACCLSQTERSGSGRPQSGWSSSQKQGITPLYRGCSLHHISTHRVWSLTSTRGQGCISTEGRPRLHRRFSGLWSRGSSCTVFRAAEIQHLSPGWSRDTRRDELTQPDNSSNLRNYRVALGQYLKYKRAIIDFPNDSDQKVNANYLFNFKCERGYQKMIWWGSHEPRDCVLIRSCFSPKKWFIRTKLWRKQTKINLIKIICQL